MDILKVLQQAIEELDQVNVVTQLEAEAFYGEDCGKASRNMLHQCSAYGILNGLALDKGRHAKKLLQQIYAYLEKLGYE